MSLSKRPGLFGVSQSISSMSSSFGLLIVSPITWGFPFFSLLLLPSSNRSISISTPVSSLSTAVRLGRRSSSCQVACMSAKSSSCKLFSASRKLSRNSLRSTKPSLLMSIRRQMSTSCSCVIGFGMYLPSSWQASENSSNVM